MFAPAILLLVIWFYIVPAIYKSTWSCIIRIRTRS